MYVFIVLYKYICHVYIIFLLLFDMR